jgi:uncharacterized cofD-like protein
MNNKKILCLGGGIGTVNLLRGLKHHTKYITVVVSMADNGGSAGRLRRLYNVIPLGDMVSCMAAMSDDNDTLVKDLLTYRFGGKRYGKDNELGGHKLGNLIMVALKDLTGSYEKAVEQVKRLFHVEGFFLSATEAHVDISATTIEGKEIFGEEKIDLGKYKGKRILEKVSLHPSDAKAAEGVVKHILEADAIILGPGDLYTNLLPVLIVGDITQALKKTRAKKIFIINVANKPFETRDYRISDYIKAIERHIGFLPFDVLIYNNNTSVPIPKKYHYTYVSPNISDVEEKIQFVHGDFVNREFPLYHDPQKLAKVVMECI